MSQHQTWRELLGHLLEEPSERQRVAALLGIRAWTLSRWVRDEVKPRPYKLRKLPDIFPEHRDQLRELITTEFPTVWSDASESGGVPAAYYSRLLAAYAHTSEQFSAWTILTLGLQQALARLDTDGHGVEISIMQCTPPSHDRSVQSLYERTGIGSAPWERDVGTRLLFLGTESLAGFAVSHGHPKVIQNIAAERVISVNVGATDEKSAAAYPIQRWNKTAGCLVVVSTQLNFFEEELCEFLTQYADIFALAFTDQEFYRESELRLRVMPSVSLQQQLSINAQYRPQVLALQQASLAPLSQVEAERQVLQQLEAVLLHTHK